MLELIQWLAGSKVVQALVIAGITALAAKFFTARGKLVWSFSHQHVYVVPRLDQNGVFPVRTQQLWFENTGRAPVEAVEIILNYRPQHLELWDPRVHNQTIMPDGRLAIQVPSLAGRSSFTISPIDTIQELPRVTGVRWKHANASFIPMRPQRAWPNWVLTIVGAVMLSGLTALLYVVLQIAVRLYPFIAFPPSP